MPNYGHWSTRRSPRHTGRPAATADLVTALAARATTRDRWLLRMLTEHRVLTTPQITALAFNTPRVTRSRLDMLYRHRALDRSRPAHAPGAGTLPWHWVLDEAGARLLAADDGCDLRAWGWRREHATALLASAKLAHTVGANHLGVGLVAHARAHPGARLHAWWGEARTAALVGDHVRPDGYLHWTETNPDGPGAGGVECFLEYDTGAEPHKTLLAKTDRYAELAETTGIALPVLLVVPGPGREAALRRHLAGTAVPVATTTWPQLAHAGPAAACWLPIGRTAPRVRLAALAAAYGPRPAAVPLHQRPDAHTDRPAPDPRPALTPGPRPQGVR